MLKLTLNKASKIANAGRALRDFKALAAPTASTVSDTDNDTFDVVLPDPVIDLVRVRVSVSPTVTAEEEGGAGGAPEPGWVKLNLRPIIMSGDSGDSGGECGNDGDDDGDGDDVERGGESGGGRLLPACPCPPPCQDGPAEEKGPRGKRESVSCAWA